MGSIAIYNHLMGIECASTCGADSKPNVPYINIPIPANIIIIIEGKKFVN